MRTGGAMLFRARQPKVGLPLFYERLAFTVRACSALLPER